MHYEINIALNGKHLFATHERSINNTQEATKLAKILNEKFPESEGYQITITHRTNIGYSTTISCFLDDETILIEKAYKNS
jgi:hypothetical protein